MESWSRSGDGSPPGLRAPDCRDGRPGQHERHRRWSRGPRGRLRLAGACSSRTRGTRPGATRATAASDGTWSAPTSTPPTRSAVSSPSTNNNTNNTTPTVAMGGVNVAVAPGYHVTGTVPVEREACRQRATVSPLHRVDFDQRRRLGRRDQPARHPDLRPRLHRLRSPATPSSRSRRTDAAGNRSDYSYSAIVNTKVFDDTSATTSAGWSRYNWTSAVGGQSPDHEHARRHAAVHLHRSGGGSGGPEVLDRRPGQRLRRRDVRRQRQTSTTPRSTPARSCSVASG